MRSPRSYYFFNSISWLQSLPRSLIPIQLPQLIYNPTVKPLLLQRSLQYTKSTLYLIVFMDAGPFYNSFQPLRFRGVPDSLALSHVEASECCLIHIDNPLSSQKGVWLNPNVRVGYNGPAYSAMRIGSDWVSTSQILSGLWKNRLKRWFTTPWFKLWVIKHRVRVWAANGSSRHESGIACLINEMQVLIWNGWAHV